jgi:hypothetical protein
VAVEIEITGPGGVRRVPVPPQAAAIELGSDPTTEVVVVGEGILPRHLRFVRTDGGHRVEPVRAGATVRVGGEDLFCKDLRAGDVIELGAWRLRWLGDRQPAPVVVADRGRRAPSRPTVERAAGRSRRLRPRRSSWLPAIAVFAAVLLAAFGLYRHFRGSTWPASPKHYVDLARAQFGNSEPQRALDTLSFALREATGPVREEALRLEADIRRVQLQTAELPKVMTARSEHDLLFGFVGRYLREAVERPAAREFVRCCDQWLERHRDVCQRHTEGLPLLAAIESERARFLGAAALDTPDTAADVVFAARSRLRFQWRDYRGAMARLDDFLRRHPGLADVERERAQLLTEGHEWLLGKLRFVDQLLARGERDHAERELQQLERWSTLPEWAPLVAERRQRLDAGR